MDGCVCVWCVWVGGWVCLCCKGEELIHNPVQPPSEKLFVKRYNFPKGYLLCLWRRRNCL